MANPKFYVGALEEATFTMSETEDAAYPLDNLSTYFTADQWRSSSTLEDQTLKMAFSVATSRNYIIIENHNLSALNPDTIVYIEHDDNASFTSPTEAANLTGAELTASRIVKAVTASTELYWRLRFWSSATLAAVPQIGQVFLNQVFDPGHSFEWPKRAKNEAFETSRRRALDGALRTAQPYKGILTFEMSFKYMDNTFESAWLRFHQKVRGAGCPFYYSDPDGNIWYLLLDKDANDIEGFRYQLNNLGSVRMVSQQVHQNPLT